VTKEFRCFFFITEVGKGLTNPLTVLHKDRLFEGTISVNVVALSVKVGRGTLVKSNYDRLAGNDLFIGH